MLSPLELSLSGSNSLKRDKGLDSSYVFISDTLHLPLIDDFSVNKFEKFDTSSSNGIINKVKFYSMNKKLDGLPFYNFPNYTSIPTFKYIHDSISGKDTTIRNSALPILVSDLSNYPIQFEEKNVYNAFSIYDTLGLLNH